MESSVPWFGGMTCPQDEVREGKDKLVNETKQVLGLICWIMVYGAWCMVYGV